MLRKVLLSALAFVGVIVLISFGSAQVACAHDPRFACSPRAGNPINITDPSKSWAYYGHLGPGQIDVYRFTVPKPLNVPWNVLLDQRDAATAGRPTAIITDGTGRAVAKANLERPITFYEPFSGQHYLMSPDQTVRLAPGRYEVRVSIPGASGRQRYTLAIGEAERFSPFEFPYLFGAVLRIRTQRY